MEITNANELQAAIDELKHANTEMEIKIKDQLKDLVEDTTDDIVTLFAVMGGGILAKKIFSPKKEGLIKSLMSYGLRGAITTAAVNNADKIKAIATATWKNIFKKKISPPFKF